MNSTERYTLAQEVVRQNNVRSALDKAMKGKTMKNRSKANSNLFSIGYEQIVTRRLTATADYEVCYTSTSAAKELLDTAETREAKATAHEFIQRLIKEAVKKVDQTNPPTTILCPMGVYLEAAEDDLGEALEAQFADQYEQVTYDEIPLSDCETSVVRNDYV